MSAFSDFMIKWREYGGVRLVDVLLSESRPVKNEMPERVEMLHSEMNRVTVLFSDSVTKVVPGDSLRKLHVKNDSNSPAKNADIAVFSCEDKDPIHLIECKYRLLPSKYAIGADGESSSKRELAVGKLFDHVSEQIESSRGYFESESRSVASGGFLVTNSIVAPTLYNDLEDLKMESPEYTIDAGDTTDLKSWLESRDVTL